MGAERGTAAHEAIVVGAGVIGLATGWRAGAARHRTLVLDAGEPAGGATRRRGRDAGAGHRGRLRRGGPDRAEPREPRGVWPAFAAELEAPPAACDAATAVGHADGRGRPRPGRGAARACTSYQRSLGLDARVAVRPASAGASSPASRRASPAGCSRRSDHQVSPRAAGAGAGGGARGAPAASCARGARGRAPCRRRGPASPACELAVGRVRWRPSGRGRGRRGVRRDSRACPTTRACPCGR